MYRLCYVHAFVTTCLCCLHSQLLLELLGGMEGWRPGENVPALGGGTRGCGRSLDDVGMQVLGNLIANFDRLPQEVLTRIAVVLHDMPMQRKVGVDSVLARLCGVPRSTLHTWRLKLTRQPMAPRVSAGTMPQNATRTLVLGRAVHKDFMGEVPLPEIQVETSLGDLPENERDADIHGGDSRRGSDDVLGRWKKHHQYDIGIRMAELATMWYVHGWTQSSFPEFMAWAKHRLPGPVFGDLNHSKRFVQ